MAKKKRKLTSAEKAAKKRRRELYQIIFIGGKKKRVRREPMIDGVTVDEFIRNNADDIWLHENEMWEVIHQRDQSEDRPQNLSDEVMPPPASSISDRD